jgi:hypothetical protein
MRVFRVIITCAVLAASCTLLTRFDSEGQACDPSANDSVGSCLDGFRCVDGKCKKGSVSPEDASVEEQDSGTDEPDGGNAPDAGKKPDAGIVSDGG